MSGHSAASAEHHDKGPVMLLKHDRPEWKSVRKDSLKGIWTPTQTAKLSFEQKVNVFMC